MIDVTSKQPGNLCTAFKMDFNIMPEDSHVRSDSMMETRKQPGSLHTSYNLGLNILPSDSEDNGEISSDENDVCMQNIQYRKSDQFRGGGQESKNNNWEREDQACKQNNTLDVFAACGGACKKTNMNIDKLSAGLLNITLADRQALMDQAYKELLEIAIKHKDIPYPHKFKKEGFKTARSPFRNKPTEHLHKVYDRPVNLSNQYGSGGTVLVVQQNIAPSPSVEQSSMVEDPQILEALNDKDFMASWNSLTANEVEQVFLKLGEDSERMLHSPPVMVQSPCQVSPELSPQEACYDTGYETASPGSTVHGSPMPRSSLSSESDQEADLSADNHSVRPLTNVINVIIPTTPVAQPAPRVKPEQAIRPLGVAVDFIKTPASQRLYELSQSTSFCTAQYSIQLARVFMLARPEKVPTNKVDVFSKSLLKTMTTQVTKAHDWDIWQLSIYVHIQFLKGRMQEYGRALLSWDERNRSLLYIAAIERYQKPVIARYLAESMAQVGYSVLEKVDKKGNTILHVVAEQGDSHVHVLCELLMATDGDGKPLFSAAMPNDLGQSALHVAMQSPHKHLTTVLKLLDKGAHPLDEDNNRRTPLHYHVTQMASRGFQQEDVEVIRKMLASVTKESIHTVHQLCSSPDVPEDLANFIRTLVNKVYGVKDQRPRSRR